MIGYITLAKDNGKTAWIRTDEIAAFTENETKVDGKTVPCLSIVLRNNLVWHFPDLTGDQLVMLMKSATGMQVQQIGREAFG